MPWARLDIPALTWEGETAVVTWYRLKYPWRDQDEAHYQLVG